MTITSAYRMFLRYRRLLEFSGVYLKRPSCCETSNPLLLVSTLAWKATTYKEPGRDKEGMLMRYVETEKRLRDKFAEKAADIREYI